MKFLCSSCSAWFLQHLGNKDRKRAPIKGPEQTGEAPQGEPQYPRVVVKDWVIYQIRPMPCCTERN